MIEPARFRKALGHYASGITVITSQSGDERIGFTCQSFYSVSMHPPLISFSVKASSYSYPIIKQAGQFAVNILTNKQIDLSNQFAMQGTEKWNNVDWQPSPLGNPIIDGTLHWLDCKVYAAHAAGDHIIVIGEVKALRLDDAEHQLPLLYYQGRYSNLAT